MSLKQDIIKAIKAINQRLTKMKKEFKNHPAIWRSYENAIHSAIDEDYFLPSGNISHGNKAVSGIDYKNLQDLLRHKTVSEIKQDIKAQAREADISEAEYMDDYETAMTAIDDPEGLFADSEPYAAFWEMVGGPGHAKPTYHQIAQYVNTGHWSPTDTQYRSIFE